MKDKKIYSYEIRKLKPNKSIVSKKGILIYTINQKDNIKVRYYQDFQQKKFDNINDIYQNYDQLLKSDQQLNQNSQYYSLIEYFEIGQDGWQLDDIIAIIRQLLINYKNDDILKITKDNIVQSNQNNLVN